MQNKNVVKDIYEFIEEVKKSRKPRGSSKYLDDLDKISEELKIAKDAGLSYKELSTLDYIKERKIPISAIRYYCTTRLGFTPRKRKSKEEVQDSE